MATCNPKRILYFWYSHELKYQVVEIKITEYLVLIIYSLISVNMICLTNFLAHLHWNLIAQLLIINTISIVIKRILKKQLDHY